MPNSSNGPITASISSTLADDNLVGDRAYCRQMLRAVADWNRARTVPISLYAEMSVDAVRDPELLELCRQANITEMFLGVETPRKAGLRETLKMQNVATDLVSAVKAIQSYGMVTVAGMILGFDSDDAAIFEDQYDFLQEAGIPIVMLGLLQAIPRTPLYERLERTGRLPKPHAGKQHALVHQHRADLHAGTTSWSTATARCSPVCTRSMRLATAGWPTWRRGGRCQDADGCRSRSAGGDRSCSSRRC